MQVHGLQSGKGSCLYEKKPAYDLEPVLVRFKTDLKTKEAKVVLANSITLTPGTITVMLEDDEFVVHCLDKELAEGMNHSIFVELLGKLERM